MLAADGALGLAVLLFTLLVSGGSNGPRPLDGAGIALIAVASLGLALRRVGDSGDLMGLAVAAGATGGYLAAGYSYGPILLTVAITMYTVARARLWTQSAVACGLAVLALLVGHVIGTTDDVLRGIPAMLAGAGGWVGLPWALGMSLRIRARDIARTQKEERRVREYEERLRIAREVHDIVGQSLALINMQAGIALHVVERHPQQIRASLEAIKGTSKDALEDLRSALAVFRREDAVALSRKPLPTVRDLDALVVSMSTSGLPVRTEVTGDQVELSGATGLAVYRIVQESLTNVLRHSGATHSTVAVDYGPEEVVVDVIDDGHGCPSGGARVGHGITGMHERARAAGGTLEAGPRAGGGFQVRARIPLREVGRS